MMCAAALLHLGGVAFTPPRAPQRCSKPFANCDKSLYIKTADCNTRSKPVVGVFCCVSSYGEFYGGTVGYDSALEPLCKHALNSLATTISVIKS